MPDQPPRNEEEPEFWTVARIAKRQDTSEKKIRREIERGNLVAHRFGGQIRVSRSDLLTYERLRREA